MPASDYDHDPEEPSFWLVWNQQASLSRIKHLSVGDAMVEAEVQANNNPGIEFFVLQPIYSIISGDRIERHFSVYGTEE